MTANERQVGGSHYKGSGYQHWDMAADADLRHQEAAASKYLARWDLKGLPVQDLEKTIHYVEKLIELVLEGRRNAQQRAPTARETMQFYCDSNGFSGPKRTALFVLVTWRNVRDLSVLANMIREMLDIYNSEMPPSPGPG